MDILNFIIAATILTLIPGPDILFVLTQSISGGKMSGVYTALGLAFGNMFHTLLICLGISALIVTFPAALTTVKYMGFIYLLYLSTDALLNRNKKVFEKEEESEIDSKKLFIKGLLMNILNPKVSLFFIAFLPQFISKNSSDPSFELFILGIIFIGIVIICFSTIALIANYLSRFLKKFNNIDFKINIGKSIIFLVLAISVIS